MAGVGERWLASRWADDRDIIAAIVDRASRHRKREREDLANLVGTAVGKAMGG